jgi:hypothetical protein
MEGVQRSFARLHVKGARALILPCRGGKRLEPLYCQGDEAVFEAELLPGKFEVCGVEG